MMLNALLPPSDGNSFLGEEVTESVFISALTWSIGAGLLDDGRTKFDSYLKRISGLSTNPSENSPVPAGEIPTALPTLFEYFFDVEKREWVSWMSVVPEYVHDPEMRYNEILVPTIDTVRSKWLVQLMVKINRPVVLVGETGTSKSATVHNFLRGLNRDIFVSYVLFAFVFSTCSLNGQFIYFTDLQIREYYIIYSHSFLPIEQTTFSSSLKKSLISSYR